MSGQPVPSQLDQVLPRFYVQKAGPYHPFGRIRIAPFGKGGLRILAESGYTTNYDDFIFQAAPDLYSGFESSAGPRCPRRFDVDGFWASEEVNSVFYLHGSVHLVFPPLRPGDEYVELSWIDDRAEALSHRGWPSDLPRMDGSAFIRTPIITGLEKLSRLQRVPFSYYYTAMARDVMRADVIYVIGSGLSDLHINTWLREARSRKPPTPILFIDLWPCPL